MRRNEYPGVLQTGLKVKEPEETVAPIRKHFPESAVAEKARHPVRIAHPSAETAADGTDGTGFAGGSFTPVGPAAAGDSFVPNPDSQLSLDVRRQRVFDYLDAHAIRYTWYSHPEAPTCEIALRYCRQDGARHCKNLFLRNHKGDRHYLVCFDAAQRLAIRDLEQRLRQGKLSFASPERLERRLGLRPGSVSPFGLINDREQHVHLFLDSRMRDWERFAFHPNDNRATVLVDRDGFFRYLSAVGNSYEFVELY